MENKMALANELRLLTHGVHESSPKWSKSECENAINHQMTANPNQLSRNPMEKTNKFHRQRMSTIVVNVSCRYRRLRLSTCSGERLMLPFLRMIRFRMRPGKYLLSRR